MTKLFSQRFINRLLLVIFGGSSLSYILRDIFSEHTILVTILGYLVSSIVALLFVRIEDESRLRFLFYPLFGVFVACTILFFVSLLRSYPDDNWVRYSVYLAIPVLYLPAAALLGMLTLTGNNDARQYKGREIADQ